MWKDLDINMGKKANGDIADSLDISAIENSLVNIWKTLPGSRRMLFPFASPSWGVLFEQIDEITARELGRMLLKSIERWEDRIQVSNLHVNADPDNGQYIVQLTYTVVSQGDITHVFTDVIRPV
jgi:phage baseplate assembly protein W